MSDSLVSPTQQALTVAALRQAAAMAEAYLSLGAIANKIQYGPQTPNSTERATLLRVSMQLIEAETYRLLDEVAARWRSTRHINLGG